MPHSTNKELILGIMVGTAGISLLLLWYHKVRKPRTAMNLPKFLSLSNTSESVSLQGDIHNSQETAAIFQGRQLQILEKLKELMTNMEELKEEIRFLKEAIPKLEEYIQDELGGKIAVHRISPQHRARKRRPTTVQSSATSNSSEEAESEGGCCKEDQSFQQNRFEDQVISEPQHYGASSISQPRPSLGLKTAHCSATLKVSSHKGSRKLSSLSSTSSFKSARSFFSERRQSLFARFQEDHTSLFRQQSRANFDYQDLNFDKVQSSSEHFDGFRSQRLFSSPKLSIVSCHKSALFFDPQSSETMINLNEIEIFSKKPNDTDVQRHITFSAPECSSVHFMNIEAGTASSLRRSTNDKLSSQQNTASFSRPICTSSACQPNGITTDIQQSGQLSKDQQHPFPNVTSHPRHSVGFSSSCRSAGSLIPRQSEGSFEDGNCPVSSQDEARSSPFEIPKIRSLQTLSSFRRTTQIRSFPISHSIVCRNHCSLLLEAPH